MSARLDSLVAVRLISREPERLARFYAEALGAKVDGLTPIPEGAGERWMLGLGAQRIELDAFAEPGAPYPPDIGADDPRFQHVAVVTAEIGATFATAMRCGARLISRDGPVKLPASSGGATAVKLRDPEGHPFELIALSPGPWDSVAANARGVRGIDHSAIVVRDLDASLRFYTALGLAERDATLNQGLEQAALDGLDSPKVDVGPLYPPKAPPHLELLHYRSASPTARAVGDRDVAATCLVWQALGCGEPKMLRDPDGHRHRLDETTIHLGDR